MAVDKQKFSQQVKDKYSFANETFSRRVKAHPKDRIDVEIGDSKQPDFKPQFKVMRWDNEVNFSMRAEEHQQATVETEGEKIKYITPDYEVHQYDRPEVSEDGGFEFEWVLPKKPASNVLTATIQTKGLNFFYQQAPSLEEVTNGLSRPENVVGSYAVYHQTKGGMNNIAGMEYKVGKAFHIYRPEAVDANGTRAWCELSVDVAVGVLTVTVPHVFLDKAKYPVVVDPTFGFTPIGASTVSPGANGIGGPKGYLDIGGVITSTTIRHKLGDWGAGENVKCSIYDSTGAYITNETDVVGGPQSADTWVSFPFSTQPRLAIGLYYVVYFVSGSMTFAADSAGFNNASSSSGTYPTWPATINLTSNLNISLYGTYTETLATTTKNISNGTSTSATANGEITILGAENATKRGFVWGTTPNNNPGNVVPGSSGYSNSVEDTGSFGTGQFNNTITGLSPTTNYYTRAYAYNPTDGYAYGNEILFQTTTNIAWLTA